MTRSKLGGIANKFKIVIVIAYYSDQCASSFAPDKFVGVVLTDAAGCGARSVTQINFTAGGNANALTSLDAYFRTCPVERSRDADSFLND